MRYTVHNYCLAAIDVKFEYASYAVEEGNTVEVCLLQNGRFERNIWLYISSQPDSAQQDDYVAVMEYVILQQRTCVMIDIVDDDLVEGYEYFNLTATSPDPAVVITSPNVTIIKIIDNDSESTDSVFDSWFLVCFFCRCKVWF